MIKITDWQVPTIIDEAIATGKRNILFVSTFIETNGVLRWFDEHPEYLRVGINPMPLYEPDENGFLQPVEGSCVIADDHLKHMNQDNAVEFDYPFGQDCIHGFDHALEIIEKRQFTNDFGDGTKKVFPLDRLLLVISMATPSGLDGFSLDEKYYRFYDEVYCLD